MGEGMRFLGELYDNPVSFFNKKRDFRTGFIWMIVSFGVFSLLNQVMIELGFVEFVRDIGALEAFLINYFTMTLGYFAITALCFVPYKMLGGKNPKDLFMVFAYSLIPVMLFWIPHIIPQAIVIALCAILMTRGVSIHAHISNKRAFAVVACFFILVVLLSLAVRNYTFMYFYAP